MERAGFGAGLPWLLLTKEACNSPDLGSSRSPLSCADGEILNIPVSGVAGEFERRFPDVGQHEP